MIDVVHLSKTYRRLNTPAVDDISFILNNGEILGLAGLNGAGKTTTINAACGVIIPSGGRIIVDGFDIVRQKANASVSMGWVAEYPNFEQNVKPGLLMQYFAGFYKISAADAKSRIKSLLKSVGLESAENRKISTFSQGMKKRFALAAAMVSDPQNYLLDEILNGLDPEGIDFVRKLLLEMKRAGKAVLLSTHMLGVLENLADRVIIIHKGKILETVTKGRMKSLGRPAMRIRVDKMDDNLMQILAGFGNLSIIGDEVIISGIKNDRGTEEEVSTALVKNGYRLSHMSVEGASLEEYFLKLVGEIS